MGCSALIALCQTQRISAQCWMQRKQDHHSGSPLTGLQTQITGVAPNYDPPRGMPTQASGHADFLVDPRVSSSFRGHDRIGHDEYVRFIGTFRTTPGPHEQDVGGALDAEVHLVNLTGAMERSLVEDHRAR
jgi:hypothetical protein